MKKFIFTILAVFITISAQAAVGVALGHNVWAGDGMPIISKEEQVSAFICRGKMTGPEAESCALKKCMKHFNVPNNAKRDKMDIIGGKCKADGWSQLNGYSIVVLGPKGNNQFIFSKALGDTTREEAMKFVTSNKFPVRKENIILDIYDGDNGYFPRKQKSRKIFLLFYCLSL